MKKGFTLIELLAVIVILAIIALIATPLIMNVIDDSKKNAFKNTAYGIIEAVELEYAQGILKDEASETTFIYENNEQISPNDKELNYKGIKPQDGEIKVNKNGKVAIAIHDGKYCAEKSYESSEVKIHEMSQTDCKLISLPNGGVCGDSFIDDRDQENIETYKTVKIGSQCWMAENLRYTGNGCLNNTWDSSAPHNACYKHNAGEGESLGDYNDWTEPQVLYQFGAAMNSSSVVGVEGTQGACPNNWYVPTDSDWKILEGYVDSKYKIGDEIWDTSNFRGEDVGKKLKSSTYWNGTDAYGFNVLPTGQRTAANALAGVGFNSYYWTSTPQSPGAWTRFLTSNLRVNRTAGAVTSSLGYGYSIRCLLNQNGD